MGDMEYMSVHHIAEAGDYHTPPEGRIRLRAMALVWPRATGSARPDTVPGIALPDGRFIFGGNQTYSSERVMLALNPGAHDEWHPQVDDTINYVMPEEQIPDERA